MIKNFIVFAESKIGRSTCFQKNYTCKEYDYHFEYDKHFTDLIGWKEEHASLSEAIVKAERHADFKSIDKLIEISNLHFNKKKQCCSHTQNDANSRLKIKKIT